MPESSDHPELPADPVSAATPRPVPAALAPVADPDEEPWQIPPRLNFPQRCLREARRWRKGWRLVLVLVLLAVSYLVWRGGRDYYRFKTWRAGRLAVEAIAASSRGEKEKASDLLGQAALLAPQDPLVLRSLADVLEPAQDLTALYALRHLAMSGQAGPADLERLCRLALDWGQPDLADATTLKAWVAAPMESLNVLQLRLTAAWLSGRGQFREAEQRLRHALQRAAGTPETAILEVGLARLLMSAASSAGMPESAAAEPLQLLSGTAYSPTASVAIRAEATRLLAGLLLHPARRDLLTPVRADLLRTAFADLSRDSAKDNPAAATGYDLAAVTVDLTADPSRREALLQDVLAKAKEAPLPQRLITARWLNENRAFSESIALCDLTPGQEKDRDWFTVRLDAFFALKEYATATRLLDDAAQPLPAHVRLLFLYRIALASGADEAATAARRRDLTALTLRGAPRDVLSTAENLERSGDYDTAYTLYAGLKAHPNVGLSARLGMVRCLDADPQRTSDLIKALESVLQLRPNSDQARGDLAYLRLLEGKPGPDDYDLVVRLQREFPLLFSFRITAALAELHRKNPAAAFALLESEPVPWDRIRPGWQAVYAGVLAANGKNPEAKAIATRLASAPLRSGERKLLESVGK